MQVTSKAERALHQKLPIDADEKILAVYRHHWFAYVSSWVVGIAVVVVVMGLAAALTMIGGDNSTLVQYRTQILAIAGVFSTLVLAATCIPVYLRSQEQVVLTEEALLQVLQPSLFASKVDQVSLQHLTDVSVHQDFFGTIFGYGHITVETPGEQDNYEFSMLPSPQDTAREIVAAHENFNAALQAGRMPSTLGVTPQMPQPQIDPQQYQQFLQYQQMVARQQQDRAAGASQSGQTVQADDPTDPPPQDSDTQNQ